MASLVVHELARSRFTLEFLQHNAKQKQQHTPCLDLPRLASTRATTCARSCTTATTNNNNNNKQQHTMLLIEKRSTMPRMRMLTPAAFYTPSAAATTLTATPTYKTPLTTTTTATTTAPTTRKRKVIADTTADKRARRTFSELEYEEMLQEAALLREELELLVMVAADLCDDLACDASTARGFSRLLARHEELLASAQDVTERQVREMAQQMAAMMQYLCRAHYAHFALVDMQEQLKDCRNRFMRFACQYATMVGLQ